MRPRCMSRGGVSLLAVGCLIVGLQSAQVWGYSSWSERVDSQLQPDPDDFQFDLKAHAAKGEGDTWMVAGWAYGMEVARLVEYADRPCYQIKTRAQSNSFFSTFFKVDDRVESIMDAIGLFSWRFEKNLRFRSAENSVVAQARFEV